MPISSHRSFTDGAHGSRVQPRRCHIVVVRTTTEPHRRGSVAVWWPGVCWHGGWPPGAAHVVTGGSWPPPGEVRGRRAYDRDTRSGGAEWRLGARGSDETTVAPEEAGGVELVGRPAWRPGAATDSPAPAKGTAQADPNGRADRRLRPGRARPRRARPPGARVPAGRGGALGGREHAAQRGGLHRRNAGLAAGRGRPARRVGTAPPRWSAGGPGGLLRVRDPRRRDGGSRDRGYDGGCQPPARCSVSSARKRSGWSRCGPWPASSMTASR